MHMRAALATAIVLFLRFGDLIAKSPDKEKTRKHLLRREKVQTAESQIAVARDGNIYIEPVTKDILNRM